MSSNIAQDIIDIKNAIEKEWDTIYATSLNINKLISDGLTWLETNEDVFWDDFEEAAAIFIATLEALDMDMLENTVDSVESDIERVLAPVLAKLSAIEQATDPAKAIDTLLGNMPAAPMLPLKPLPKVVQDLEVLSAATFKEVFGKIFDEDFSVAIKKIPPRTATSPSTPTPTESQDKVIASGLEELLFSAYESNFETWIEGIDIQTIKTNIEQRVTSAQMAALQTNLINAYTAIEAAIKAAKKKAQPVKVSVILDQLKAFVKSELDDFRAILEAVLTNLKSDLSGLRTQFDTLLSYQADADSDFALLYQDLFQSDQPPTLREAIAFIIAIPVTLTSQAITGKTIQIPQSAYLQSTIDDTGKAWLLGSLKVADVIISVAQKGYGYYRDSHDMPPVSYKYKIAMGCLSTVQSALMQVAILPKHYSLKTHYKDNLLWYLGWGTGPIFSFMKWTADAYATKEKERTDNYKKPFIDDVQSFRNTFQQHLTTLNDKYSVLQSCATGSDLKAVGTYETEVNSMNTELGKLVTGLRQEAKFKENLKKLLNINYDSVNAELKSMKEAVIGDLKARHLRTCKTQLGDFKTALDKFLLLQFKFKDLLTFAKLIANHPKGTDNKNVSSNKFLNEVCPLIDLAFIAGTLGLKIYLYNTEEDSDPATLGVAISGAISSAASDLEGLYYYYNPPDDTEAAQKDKVDNATFVFGKLTEIGAAYNTLNMSVKISKVSYSNPQGTDPAQITVAFNYDVTKGSSDSYFTLTPAAGGNAITNYTVSKVDDATYTLTFDDASYELPMGKYKLQTVDLAFNDPWHRGVSASKTFSTPVGISNATYDPATKTVTVTFFDSVTKNSPVTKGYFILRNGGTTTTVSKISGSGDTYTFTLKGALIAGTCALSIVARAFNDAGGNPVSSVFSFTVSSKPGL